jgi:hypothetical protein
MAHGEPPRARIESVAISSPVQLASAASNAGALCERAEVPAASAAAPSS